MKKILFLSLFISFKMFGQSVTISPLSLTRNGGSSNDISIIKSIADYPTIIGYRTGGTTAVPTNTTNGMELLRIGAGGRSGAVYPNSSIIRFFATQDWKTDSIGTKMTFSTTTNDTKLIRERMVIDHDGKVGIGLTSPNQILDINGRMRIRHTPGFTSGVWMSNSTNSLSDADGAFIGLENDNQAGIWINNAWRFGFNRNGNAVITGFTQLGNNVPAGAAAGATAPSIKTLKLTGTTASSQGGFTSLEHGLTLSKIVGIQVSVITPSDGIMPAEHSYIGGYEYSYNCSSTKIYIYNKPSNSSYILSKPITILITYEE